MNKRRKIAVFSILITGIAFLLNGCTFDYSRPVPDSVEPMLDFLPTSPLAISLSTVFGLFIFGGVFAFVKKRRTLGIAALAIGVIGTVLIFIFLS